MENITILKYHNYYFSLLEYRDLIFQSFLIFLLKIWISTVTRNKSYRVITQ